MKGWVLGWVLLGATACCADLRYEVQAFQAQPVGAEPEAWVVLSTALAPEGGWAYASLPAAVEARRPEYEPWRGAAEAGPAASVEGVAPLEEAPVVAGGTRVDVEVVCPADAQTGVLGVLRSLELASTLRNIAS